MLSTNLGEQQLMVSFPPRSTNERIPLGSAPRPVHGTDLARRLTSAIYQAAEEPGLIAAVNAQLDGPEVSELSVDLTGSTITLKGATERSVAARDDARPVVAREPGRLERITLRANPLEVEGIPITGILEATLSDTFEWVTDTSGALGAEIGQHFGHQMRACFNASAPREAVVAWIHRLLDESLADVRLRLVSFDLDLEPAAGGGAQIAGQARIAKGALTASVRFETMVAISVDEIRFVDMAVTSRNLLLKPVLRGLRGQIRKSAEASTVPLHEPGDQFILTSLGVTVGPTITVAATLEPAAVGDPAT